jgi:hypothetical protein
VSSRPPRDNLPQSNQAAESLNSSDEEALEQFCAEIEIDEISFDFWCDHHHNLDLIVEVSVTPDELRQDYQTTVSVTRTFKRTTSSGIQGWREKLEKDIIIPAGVTNGHEIAFSGLGDSHDDRHGDLRIIIRIA